MLARVSGLPFSILNDFNLNEEEDYEVQIKEFQKKLQELSHSQILLNGANPTVTVSISSQNSREDLTI